MAGNIAERVSMADNVVWFWFAPFKGVVDQTAAFLREQFHGLRLRTMTDDRNAVGTKSGDVFVTTWSLVATRVRDRRSVRQTGEQTDSVDDLVDSLRDMGFRIGVVVDEAHHGFHGQTQAAEFFRTVLKPEFTILVTATPDDADLEDLKRRMQIGTIHRIGVSRTDAVGDGPGEGLIKRGIKAVAWRLEEGSDALVDFESTALREGVALHQHLKSQLQQAGVNLTPLMLVQVDSRPKSVERAKAKLLELGFTESQIATHTANEPDAGLLALANDESREVLVFKMAVALGFDAPRAWTLVSMRAAQDEDFGVQLVGRILRVHRRLQGRTVPESLQYGYVLLANLEAQGGLDAAGQRINRMQTQYATVSPTMIIYHVGGQNYVQSAEDGGQLQLYPEPPAGAIFAPPLFIGDAEADQEASGERMLWDEPEIGSGHASPTLRAILAARSPATGRFVYSLKDGVPRRFKSQELPENEDVTEEECAVQFVNLVRPDLEEPFGQENVRVTKRTLEIFTRAIQLELDFAPPSHEEMRRQAQRALLSLEMLSAKELRRALVEELQTELLKLGFEEAADTTKAHAFLDQLLSENPKRLRDAQRAALAAKAQIVEAAEIPPHLESERALITSRCNVYGVLPPDLNTWEKPFVVLLDGDDTGTILWWHRNPPRKNYSVNVLLESGKGFYPDFIIGVRERPTEDCGLLTDTKYAYETTAELPKLLAEHAAYGRVKIVTKDENGNWYLAETNPQTGAARRGPRFRIADAAGY